jgi:hypothetical protein
MFESCSIKKDEYGLYCYLTFINENDDKLTIRYIPDSYKYYNKILKKGREYLISVRKYTDDNGEDFYYFNLILSGEYLNYFNYNSKMNLEGIKINCIITNFKNVKIFDNGSFIGFDNSNIVITLYSFEYNKHFKLILPKNKFDELCCFIPFRNLDITIKVFINDDGVKCPVVVLYNDK